MDMSRAVVWLDCPSESLEKPLMLETVLFCPVLSWVGETLKADGVRRFFVVCAPEFAQEARACFLPEDDVAVSGRDGLPAFLEGDGDVIVVAAPVLPVAGGDLSAFVFSAPAEVLRRNPGAGSDAEGAVRMTGYTFLDSAVQLRSLILPCRDAIVRRHIARGVSFVDPASVYIDPRVRIGRGTEVLPGSILRGRTVIGENCTIGPQAMIRSCTVGSDTEINASQINDSTVGSGTHVGPFAYVRPGSRIGDGVKVGDFVEVKNSVIGDGTKISHLTYVGDSDVGKRVNFGCGTVTTNYDGFHKYRCTVGDGAFLGCNTNLIAPVTVGEGAYTAAGSTITEEVPPDALGIARARQTNLPDWAGRRRRLHEKD